MGGRVSLLVVLDLDEGGDGEGDEAEGHDDPEEVLVADVAGDEAGDDAGDHDAAEVLAGGADGEDGGGALAAGEGDEVEGVGGESESVADLLDADAGADEPEVVGGDVAEIDIDDVGQGDAEDEGPEASLQAPLGHSPSADDATQQQADDAQRSVDESEVNVVHGESAFCGAALEEERHNLGEQSLGQTEEEDEAESGDEVGLGDEDLEGLSELTHLLREVEAVMHRLLHLRQDEGMIQSQQEHQAAKDEENHHPR